jgi:hypothetical protein
MNLAEETTMKTRKQLYTIAILALAAVTTVIGVVSQSFPGWPVLTQGSPEIVVARCTDTSDHIATKKGDLKADPEGIFESQIEVLFVMKGNGRPGSAKLWTMRGLRPGEEYAIFCGHLDNGIYQAMEDYRQIPLGSRFPTELLASKSLNEQVQTILQYRYRELNRELERALEEKRRLEEGIKR